MSLNNLDIKDATGILDKTQFNELIQVPKTAFIQSTPVYNLVPNNFETKVAESGTAGVVNKQYKVTTGTTSGGFGQVRSLRSLNYRTGSSSVCQFSCIFTSGVANSRQISGFITIADELGFGYNGTEFGVWNNYGGTPEVRTLTLSAAASGAETVTLTLNSVEYSISVTSGTTAHNAYEIAAWLNNSSNQTVWEADQLGSTVIVSAASDGAKAGTYSITSSGTTAGSIAQTTAGVTKTTTFVASSDWNRNTFSTLDPTDANVYQISYTYTGFSLIQYSVMDSVSGNFTLVHSIRSLNTASPIDLGNPSLRTGMYCISTGSTTDISVQVGGFSSYLQSQLIPTKNPHAFSNSQEINSSTYTNILTIRNRKTLNGIYNLSEIQPLFVTMGNEGTKNATIEIRITNNPGVEQNFSSVGSGFVADSDTTSATISGGELITAVTLAGGTSSRIELDMLQIRVGPGYYIVIDGILSSGANSVVTVSFTWYEDT